MSGWYRFGDPGDDTVAHLNTRSDAGRCEMPRFPKDNHELGTKCARISIALCDAKNCDKNICVLHRTRHATKPNTDYCSDHKSLAKT